MMLNLKALVVVLSIALAVFALARPMCVRFIAPADFDRRRNVWLTLTATSFLSPSFWWFFCIAMPVLLWASRRDSNAVGLYFFMLPLVPPGIGAYIPVVGINELFKMDWYRMLSLAVLLPAIMRIPQPGADSRPRGLGPMEVLLLAYAVLDLALFMPYESFTHTLRRACLFALDIFVVYMAVSRICVDRRVIADALASFCVAAAILAPIAVFESAKGWLLYQGIGEAWGDATPFAYLFRDGALRAQGSAGHAIALGYLLAIATGFWLHLRSGIAATATRRAVTVWLWLGLLAAYSRAPWLVGVAVFFAYVAASPDGGAARLVRSLLLFALAGAIVLLSPFGDRVIDNLPFFGTVDAGTVVYRQQLAELSLESVLRNPIFGDPHALVQLEELRQGQGIIDIVNVYAGVALFHGLVGLALFVGFFLLGMRQIYPPSRFGADRELHSIGASLFACMAGTLIMMGALGFVAILAKLFYALPAMATGLAHAARANGGSVALPPGFEDRLQRPREFVQHG